MAKSTSDLSHKLDSLASSITGGAIGRAKLWGGADVVVCADPPPPRATPGFYPDPQFVVTPYAAELSWLFVQLRDAFVGAIDYRSKYEFYGRLAGAAERYSAETPSASKSVVGMLSDVVAEARRMAEEIGREDAEEDV